MEQVEHVLSIMAMTVIVITGIVTNYKLYKMDKGEDIKTAIQYRTTLVFTENETEKEMCQKAIDEINGYRQGNQAIIFGDMKITNEIIGDDWKESELTVDFTIEEIHKNVKDVKAKLALIASDVVKTEDQYGCKAIDIKCWGCA